MADMFGAPVGFQAAIHDAGVLAQSRLFEAQAAEKESAAADQQLLQTIASGQALAQQRAAQGQMATLGELGVAGQPRSQAEPVEELLKAAHAQGMSPAKTITLAKTAAEIRKNEAVATNHQAQQQEKQFAQQLKGAEILSSFAAAALASPQQYDQMRLQAAQQGLPVQQLPPRFDAGALTALRDQGIKAIDGLKLEQQKLKDASSKALNNARIAQSNQTIATGKARETLLKQQSDAFEKNGGTGAKPMNEAQKVLAAQRKANMAAKSLKDNPAPPADLQDPLYHVGQTFTIKGQVYQMIGRDARDIPMVVPRPVASIPAIAQTSDELLADDEEIDLGD